MDSLRLALVKYDVLLMLVGWTTFKRSKTQTRLQSGLGVKCKHEELKKRFSYFLAQRGSNANSLDFRAVYCRSRTAPRYIRHRSVFRPRVSCSREWHILSHSSILVSNPSLLTIFFPAPPPLPFTFVRTN